MSSNNATPPEPYNDLLESLIVSILGPETSGVRSQIYKNAVARRNTPSRWEEHLKTPEKTSTQGSLWIVDRVLSPQTLPDFISFMGGGKDLPGGAQTNLPRLHFDVQLLMQPLSEWAPPPYNTPGRPIMGDLGARMGSFEDSTNLQPISKTLFDMKARLWDGHTPMSDRRWEERGLDEPQNFALACEIIVNVLSVFHYLNSPRIRYILRKTYNAIWDHLKTFEDAFNAKRRLESQDPVSPTALWAEYMRAHYARMEACAHAWLLRRLNKMKEAVLLELSTHIPDSRQGDFYDDKQWALTNTWQDIIENLAHADVAIFLPMDGFKGCSSASATGRPSAMTDEYSGTTPVCFSPSINKRRKDYHMRRRQLNLMLMVEAATLGLRNAGEPFNSPGDLSLTCGQQAESQDRTREELRGITPDNVPLVLREIKEHDPWGFVAYKGCSPSTTEAKWSEFRAKFEGDIGNWGKELGDIDSLRARSKIHWLDPNELGLTGTDVETLKRHFKSFQETPEFPKSATTSVFLLADDASIESYLKPIPTPPLGLVGDFGGFIVAVESSYDANEPNDREDESPGYPGTIRILGSVLWDDLCALLSMQTLFLEDLWPLAMYHPFGVYTGAVGQKQSLAWRSLRKMRNDFVSSFLEWRENQACVRGSQ